MPRTRPLRRPGPLGHVGPRGQSSRQIVERQPQGFGFLSAGTYREIAKEIRFYVQTSAGAGVTAQVAYGTALRLCPEQFGRSVERSSGVLADLLDVSLREGA